MRRTIGRCGVLGVVAATVVVAFAAPALAGHAYWVGDGDTQPDPYPDRFVVSESDGSITLRFTPHLDPTHVTLWTVEPRTAADGSDVVAASGRWPDEDVEGEQTPSVTIQLIDDEIAERTEVFGVLLWLDGYPDMNAPPPTDADSCVEDGFCDYALVEIRDDDPASPQGSAASDPGRDPPDPAAAAPDGAGGGDAGGSSNPDVAAAPPPEPSQPPATTEPQAAAASGRQDFEPGPGFELLGERVDAEHAAQQRDQRSDGGGSPMIPVVAVTVAVAGAGLAMWAWRRRRAW